jgi:hypothetical protein
LVLKTAAIFKELAPSPLKGAFAEPLLRRAISYSEARAEHARI